MTRVNIRTKMIIAFCRSCHSRIRFVERPELFDIVSCPECQEEFEVVNLSPIQLDWPSDFIGDYEWSDNEYDDRSDNWGSVSNRFPS